MALDATARKANLRDSLKKYFLDTYERAAGIPCLFDIGISKTPNLKNKTVNRWLSIVFGPLSRDSLSDLTLRVFCCTREDAEGFRLAQLTDTLIGGLKDSTMTDGMKRITLYRSHPTDPWTEIGYLYVTDIDDGEEFNGPDMTKVSEVLVRIKWGTTI